MEQDESDEPSAESRLGNLRDGLMGLEPYPWSLIDTWIASARPLMRAHYGEHFDDFVAVTATPKWYYGLYVPASDGGRWGKPSRGNGAELHARENDTNQKLAAAAKANILGFLVGLLSLPKAPAARPKGLLGVRAIHIDDLSDAANELLNNLRDEYIKAEHPNHKVWNFSPGSGGRATFNELQAHGYIVPMGMAGSAYVFTDAGQQLIIRPSSSDAGRGAVIHYGELHVGPKYTSTVTANNVGSVATGDHATSIGNVNSNDAVPITQEQHKASISQGQVALVRDQDALERIDDRLYEALGQFLTSARKTQIDLQSMAEVQAKMKETLDEIWAQQEAKGMKPHLLPKTLEVAEWILKSPAMAEVAKKLIES
jgi:hypothetical protein